MRLKPARPGLAIPDPAEGDMLPERGRDVVMSRYWRRRLRAHDVVEVAAPATGDSSRPPTASASRDGPPADPVLLGDRREIQIPDYWRDLPWTQPKGGGLTIRGLAAALSDEPIITKDEVIEAIEAELSRREQQED